MRRKSCKKPKTSSTTTASALHTLQWNTSLSLTLDKNGEAIVPAFYGDYLISSGQKKTCVSLEKDKEIKKVRLDY
jgi:hypothetical protein